MVNPNIGQYFQNSLPADCNEENTTRQVLGACYSYVTPKQTAQPKLIALAEDLAEQIGFDREFYRSQEFVRVFSGNAQLSGMRPYAMCYGGHQFGNWAGQLGDGRAINLGDVEDSDKARWHLQLKGAGPTPYSRFADGLAVLRSSIREFLCSEAMHHLGIPTTRALSLITTGDQVERDMFYNGNSKMEPGAIVCRVAQSFLRFGSYEIFASRQDTGTLTRLVEFTLRTHYPDHYATYKTDQKQGILNWFSDVCDRTRKLVVEWARVGFVHGVLNTDNMSILGLTIDYGPYGWLDNFDPDWTPNTTDAQHRRYRFANQAPVAQWNLMQLANALFPLVGTAQELEALLVDFGNQYDKDWLRMMGRKCGFPHIELGQQESWQSFFQQLEKLMRSSHIDMTLFYRHLADLDMDAVLNLEQIKHFTQPIAYRELGEEDLLLWQSWLMRYRDQLQAENISSVERKSRMDTVNPAFILRNYLSQQAIDLAYEGEMREIQNLYNILKKPYYFDKSKPSYFEKRPEWAKNKAGCSMLSCSS